MLFYTCVCDFTVLLLTCVCDLLVSCEAVIYKVYCAFVYVRL